MYRSISLSSKIRLMRSLVTSIFLYACESWTLTAELKRRVQAMELKCYRKILHISCKDHVTKKEVRAKIHQAIGPHEDLLTIVKTRKLQLYGHVSLIRSGQNLLARHSERGKICQLINWYFEPSQPQRITSRLKTMFNLAPIYSARKSSNHKIIQKPQNESCTQIYMKQNIYKHRTQHFRRIKSLRYHPC